MKLEKSRLKASGFIISLLHLSSSVIGGNTSKSSTPNILFIAADDLKPNLGCYGDNTAKTPNIDALGKSGVVFANNHCQWAVSGPSRASLITGLTPQNTGVMGFQYMRTKNPDVITLPQYFKNNGYFTAATGKINDPRCVGSAVNPKNNQGIDGKVVDDPISWSIPYREYDHDNIYKEGEKAYDNEGTDLKQYIDYRIANEGISLLQEAAKKNQPFFIGVGFKKPHLPFVAPKEFWNLYDREKMPVAPFQKHCEGEVKYSWNNAQELREYEGSPKEGAIPLDYQKTLLQGYYACVSMVDSQVGRLIAELDRLGLRENTIIVFWGDHGFHLGDHGDWGKHTNMENGTRSPLIIVDPRNNNHHSTSNPSGFLDIYPTLCELAGLPIPSNLDGVSLVPMLNNPSNASRTGIVTMFKRMGAAGYAYRDQRYRYVEWVQKGEVVAKELYDYKEDPLETINFAVNHPEKEQIMNELARKLHSQKEWKIR